MLLLEDAGRQGIGGITRHDRHRALDDDGPAIELRGHEMNGHAAHLHAMLDRLLLRIESRERRKQRWMDVQDAIRKGLEQRCLDHPHVAGEYDQFDSYNADLKYRVYIQESRPREKK